MPETGFLVIGDISGFTQFLTDTELEHGPQVTAELLEQVMNTLSAALHVESVEGDAVFAVVEERELGRAVHLLDVVEGAYIAFKDRQRQMRLATTCTCNACRAIPNLNLKLIVHHGSWLRQTIGNRSQVAGTDVIATHRLLKNSLNRSSGYLLMTDAAVARIGMNPDILGFTAHRERYEHLGEIPCQLRDLESVWAQATERRVVKVDPARAIVAHEGEVPAPPTVVWDWLFTPGKREQWQAGLSAFTEEGLNGGRPQSGMTMHCHHGKEVLKWEVVDYRPLRYATIDVSHGLQVMITLEPGEGVTTVRHLYGFHPSASLFTRLMKPLLAVSIRRFHNRVHAILVEKVRQAMEAKEEAASA
jgi:uncharacterized protein YndB with AHSA1/START domain